MTKPHSYVNQLHSGMQQYQYGFHFIFYRMQHTDSCHNSKASDFFFLKEWVRTCSSNEALSGAFQYIPLHMPHTPPYHSDLVHSFKLVKYTGNSTPKFSSLLLYFFHINEFPTALKKKFTLLKVGQYSLFSIVLSCRLYGQEVFVQFPAETRVVCLS